jgi:hypothetical protein
MAELLVLVVLAGVVLLYAVERTRKLRARARQMSAMNERLDVAAAKVDEQQVRRQARVRASAELTSVLPAIKRPPLTLPGVPGSAAGPAGEPAAPEPAAAPAAERAAGHAPAAAGDTPAAGDDPAAAADAGDIPGAGVEESPTAQAAQDPAGSPPGQAVQDRAGSPAAGDRPPAGDGPETAGEVRPGPARTPDSTQTMSRVTPDATAAPGLQVTSDGTMIMPPVLDQEPPPAGEATRPPAFSRPRPRTSRPPAGQPRAREPRASRSRAGQPHAGQLRASQPGSGQQCTSQEQANRD